MEDLFIVSVRVINAVIWTYLFVVFVRDERPAIPLVRNLIMAVVVGGTWMLVIGGVAIGIGLDLRSIRFMYTAYTAIAAIVALAILTGPWRR